MEVSRFNAKLLVEAFGGNGPRNYSCQLHYKSVTARNFRYRVGGKK